MKKKLVTSLILLLILGLCSFWYYKRVLQKTADHFPTFSITEASISSEAKNGETEDKGTKAEVSDIVHLNLFALSACLMDASTGRVLYEKDGYKEMPMASTTKIMTLLVVLENGNLEDTVTISKNAARQPDVQLNINTGEQYRLGDLIYSLMLESHNDTAVAIAEHVGGSVEGFCDMMTAKAKAIGAMHTSFKTPNGLDADGHYTTAADLALIGSYAISNEDFLKIVGTQTHQFEEITNGRSFTVNNKDRFLSMMNGAVGIKTGFTGKAGYCFVGAIKKDGRDFVSVVLGSGWPPNKNYKWQDTQKLMNYGLDNYTIHTIESLIPSGTKVFPVPDSLSVLGGQKPLSGLTADQSVLKESILAKEGEQIIIKTDIVSKLTAPVLPGTKVGSILYLIGNEVMKEIPVVTVDEVKEVDYPFFLQGLIKLFFCK